MAGNGRPRGTAAVEQRHARDRIRNVVLVGHAAAGKTTLVEALLAAHRRDRPGRPGRGRQHGLRPRGHRAPAGRSVSLAVAATAVTCGVKVNLVDTPGHADFVGEVRAGLRAADAALFVVSAVDGVDGITRMLWEECARGRDAAGRRRHPPRPAARRLRRVRSRSASGSSARASSRSTCRCSGDDEMPAGLIGLLSQKVFDYSSGTRVEREADPEHVERDRRPAVGPDRGDHPGVRGRHPARPLARRRGGRLRHPRRRPREGRRARLVPPGAAGRRADRARRPRAARGDRARLPVAAGAPAADGHRRPTATPREADRVRPGRPARRRGGQDDDATRTSAGSASCGSSPARCTRTPPVHVSGHFAQFAGRRPRAPRPRRRRAGRARSRGRSAATLSPVDRRRRRRHRRRRPADPRRDRRHPVRRRPRPALMEPWVMPEPLLPTARDGQARAPTRTSSRRAWPGSSPRTRRCASRSTPTPSRWCVWSMGEAHLEVLLDRLRGTCITVDDTQPVKVALRETFARPGAGHGRHVKQSGGHGQYAVCDIEVEPLPEGSGFEFVDKVVGGAVPRQFIPSVEKGVRAQMERGVARRLPDGRPAGDAGRRQGAQRRLLRRRVPDWPARWPSRRPRPPRASPCSSRSTTSGSSSTTSTSARS